MKAPAGSIVKITYDSPDQVNEGDALKTTSGRLYICVEVRRQEKGIHAGRWHIKALVTDSLPDDFNKNVHGLMWYPRKKKRK